MQSLLLPVWAAGFATNVTGQPWIETVPGEGKCGFHVLSPAINSPNAASDSQEYEYREKTAGSPILDGLRFDKIDVTLTRVLTGHQVRTHPPRHFQRIGAIIMITVRKVT